MNKVIILVGNIGSGKTSWINNNEKCVIVSKDLIRKSFAMCTQLGSDPLLAKGYVFDDILEKYVHNITLNYYEGVLHLSPPFVIYDETNMSKESRQPFIELAKKYNYIVDAIVFPDFGPEEHVKRRMLSNHGTVPKDKWYEVYNYKKNRYEEPVMTEGFSSITFLKEKTNA